MCGWADREWWEITGVQENNPFTRCLSEITHNNQQAFVDFHDPDQKNPSTVRYCTKSGLVFSHFIKNMEILSSIFFFFALLSRKALSSAILASK